MNKVIYPYAVGTAITSVVILAYATLGDEQVPFLVTGDDNIEISSSSKDMPNLNYDRYTLVERNYLSDEKKIEVLHHFASGLLENIEDIPNEFSEIIQDNFWELV